MGYHGVVMLFPIMLDLTGRVAVVVGGGPVGLRKAANLADAGAVVRLVAPDLHAQPPAGVQTLGEPYRPEHLAGAALVFACTDSPPLNARIAADARARGAWVNAADQPEDCDFHLPAVTCDGDVTLAVATAGSAPALAGHLRDHLAKALPPSIGAFAALLGQFRRELRNAVPNARSRMQILKTLSGLDVHAAWMAGGEDAVRQILNALLGRQEEP